MVTIREKLKSHRGSLTAEASIAFACLFFFILVLMTYLGGLYTEVLVQESLVEASLRVRAQEPLIREGENLKIGEELIYRNMVKSNFTKAFSKRGKQRFFYKTDDLLETLDVSDSKLYYEDGYSMKLAVSMEWPLLFFDKKVVHIERSLICKPFTSFRDPVEVLREEGFSHVYMADHPSVYHTNPNCRSIKNRNKTKVTLDSIEDQFRECKFCQNERRH